VDDSVFEGRPRLELARSDDGMLLGLTGDAGPCGIEISPDSALRAGMWLWDAAIGRPIEPVELSEIVGPSTLRLGALAGGDGSVFTVTLDVGEEPAQIALNRVQAMLAGEHLIAHAIRAGARLSPAQPAGVAAQ
jgi:hypothetical protein